jgi:hypothetical protein
MRETESQGTTVLLCNIQGLISIQRRSHKMQQMRTKEIFTTALACTAAIFWCIEIKGAD